MFWVGGGFDVLDIFLGNVNSAARIYGLWGWKDKKICNIQQVFVAERKETPQDSSQMSPAQLHKG